jgi:hypothetical protein
MAMDELATLLLSALLVLAVTAFFPACPPDIASATTDCTPPEPGSMMCW